MQSGGGPGGGPAAVRAARSRGLSEPCTARRSPTSVRRMKLTPRVGTILVGCVCGLAWAASLRGWMTQVAGTGTTFTWVGTFLLILIPGALLGALLGWAEHLRRTGGLRGRRQRWLVLSPLMLAAALLDPSILRALVTTGEGGGALGVVIIGLTGGHALSGRGARWARVTSGLVAFVLIAGCSLVATENAPLTTAHGAWVAVQVTSLLLVLCLACSIPRRTTPAVREAATPSLVRGTV